MERADRIKTIGWSADASAERPATGALRFTGVALSLAVTCLVLAGWLPLPFSIATVFLFAGPHNWFEARYFLSRLPARFGRSRNFFVSAFTGVGVLTVAYAAIPFFGYRWWWRGGTWLTAAAVWNTAALAWVAALVLLRAGQSPRRNWGWVIPAACALAAVNWFAPDWFGLGLVYLHPLVALWFLDRHLGRTRPEWRGTYRRCLMLLPVFLGVLWWNLAGSTPLAADTAVASRITAHAGGGLLPGVSSHLLVSTHVFLETLHYAVWLLAIPVIARTRMFAVDPPPGEISVNAFVVRPLGGIVGENSDEARRTPPEKNRVNAELPTKSAFVAPPSGGILRRIDPRALPLFNHPRGWPKAIAFVMALGAAVTIILWAGFSLDYATTRDIYFTFAMAHVLAEAPFLLRML
jgi:hypothetical protein